MKLLIVADLDELHWTQGEGQADAVIACGDLYDQVILEAARAYSCSVILAVKGNHDSPAPFPPPIVDLHQRATAHSGITFGGLNGSWRYKPRGHFLYEQHEVRELLASFPRVDVLVSHNAPRGIHDREDDVHIGFDGLTDYVRRTAPALVIHGHQHVNAESRLGETRIIGVYGHRVLEI